jgi:hypothetical protein
MCVVAMQVAFPSMPAIVAAQDPASVSSKPAAAEKQPPSGSSAELEVLSSPEELQKLEAKIVEVKAFLLHWMGKSEWPSAN